ncbi:hypothetical protein EMIHUDRAFT_205328 [Emiliania huxleyi CCMP1516]|uniref:TsaA-like domain-containing protein n=2 Tax=Emiliania huxleyi TaxID=2903 RepID=A0A0D3JS51_EMIH1|nr:hypothetical protein EMIHUDRAFT_205328 [Emiliania huxleyi CCMP1516]EOD26336.1 hypothetical protein EMIHUDRAFT_205328 [Emiliania huxleyi CCMP1516]|eukprot:XP_005778765.1 hypothetical protein EMIHUDRAFT_205328 [Emiliania huxleyi CCMP1516]
MLRRLALTLTAAALLAAIAEARRLYRLCAALRHEIATQQSLRAAERAGRTVAERRLRRAASVVNPATCGYRPIGHIESCFVERRGTPRQGLLVPDARARLRLDPRAVQPAAALEGLEGFSHVHPPGLLGGSIGLFATRTPHRPNPIGLSLAALLHVEGGTLLLGGADLIDGTPVLDVKPYLLHDAPAGATVPSWCAARSDASRIASVHFTAAAEAQLAAAVADGSLRFYTDLETARSAISQMLQLDIRSLEFVTLEQRVEVRRCVQHVPAGSRPART